MSRGRKRKTVQKKPLEDCPLSEVTRRIHEIVAGQYSLSLPRSHGVPRMRQRGIDDADIPYVLKRGRIIEKHSPGGQWRYTMRGKTTDGREIDVSIAVDEGQSRITVVTVMPTTRKGEWR